MVDTQNPGQIWQRQFRFAQWGLLSDETRSLSTQQHESSLNGIILALKPDREPMDLKGFPPPAIFHTDSVSSPQGQPQPRPLTNFGLPRGRNSPISQRRSPPLPFFIYISERVLMPASSNTFPHFSFHTHTHGVYVLYPNSHYI